MSTVLRTSTSTSTEACSTPNNGATLSLKRSGWTFSTADNERSTNRQNSDRSGSALKRQKTPSSSLTTNNERLSTRSDRRSLGTECDRSDQGDIDENDFVAQRNFAVGQDGSLEDSDVKVKFQVVTSLKCK